ncbi:uncharacterized protein KGF55_001191 [Candida pseudojiufengensis]|uniref:uncharacterized protein n=1 Tax=Candida pseudojiufengensis TaxID=497109 RepID=UPI002224C535|nr:uncharacterized protein KGF55_001191 [Candida pseudojiufengensis]KAI5965828.1 hypothetical protein KGF55_001191 [Candida pseudojiufengensis]
MSSLDPSQQHTTQIPTGGVPPIGETSPSYGNNDNHTTTSTNNSSSQQQHTQSNPFTDPSLKSTQTAPLATGSSALGINNTHQSNDAFINLLTWKNPIYTGKIFGSILFGLIIFKTINWIKIIFHLSYILLLISASIEYLGKLITGKGFITNYKLRTANQKSGNVSIAKKFNNEILPIIGSINIEIEEFLKKIFYASDIETTLKSSGISYILFKLTTYISLFNLFVISIILLFTLPFIYTNNKKEIDSAIAKYTDFTKTKIEELTSQAHKSAGPYLNDLIKKLGPIGEFIQQKIPTRTAGSTVGNSKATSYGTAADTHGSTTTPSGSTTTTTKPSTETSTGVSTGRSQFPNAPTSGLHPTTVEDVGNDSFDDFADTTQDYKPTLH